jgi:flagellin-specific chaperone FliS
MLAQRDPNVVYRKIDFDARVSAANPRELVTVCYEQLVSALGGALIAAERGNIIHRNKALTRATSALTALQMGVSGDNPVAGALVHMYTSARRAVMDSVVHFNAATISQIRADFMEIAESMANAAG